jgi:hypothetical protein
MATDVEELSRLDWSSHNQKHVLDKEKIYGAGEETTTKYIYIYISW